MTDDSPPVVPLAEVRCEDCGSVEIVAVMPGSDPIRHPIAGTIDAGEPLRAWCARCWPWPRQGNLFHPPLLERTAR